MSTERPVRLRVRSSNAADPSARARAEHAAAAAAAANADAGGAERYQSRSSADVSLEESGDKSVLANVFVASAAALPEVRSPSPGPLVVRGSHGCCQGRAGAPEPETCMSVYSCIAQGTLVLAWGVCQVFLS